MNYKIRMNEETHQIIHDLYDEDGKFVKQFRLDYCTNDDKTAIFIVRDRIAEMAQHGMQSGDNFECEYSFFDKPVFYKETVDSPQYPLNRLTVIRAKPLAGILASVTVCNQPETMVFPVKIKREEDGSNENQSEV